MFNECNIQKVGNNLLRQSFAKIRKTGIGPKLFCFGLLEHAKFGRLNEQPNRYVVWNQRLFNVWVKEDQEILGENGRNHINRSRALAASQEKLPAPVGIYNPIQNCTNGHLLNSFFCTKRSGATFDGCNSRHHQSQLQFLLHWLQQTGKSVHIARFMAPNSLYGTLFQNESWMNYIETYLKCE